MAAAKRRGDLQERLNARVQQRLEAEVELDLPSEGRFRAVWNRSLSQAKGTMARTRRAARVKGLPNI